MVGLCFTAYILSKADVKITIKHKYDTVEQSKLSTQEQVNQQVDVDKLYEKEDIPSFDDIVKVVQEMIGGTDDVEDNTWRD